MANGNTDIPENFKRNDLSNTISEDNSFAQQSVGTGAVVALSSIVTISNITRGVRVTVVGGNIRVRDDDVDPTTSVGETRKPGIYWYSRGEAQKLNMIAESGTVEVQAVPQTYQS